MDLKKYINNIKENKFWKKLFVNFFSAFIGETGASGILVITTVILVRAIGSNNYGILALAQSYMTIMDTLINAQSWQAVIRFCSKALVQKDYKKMAAYIKLGVLVDLTTAIIGMLVALASITFIAKLLNWNHDVVLCSIIFSIQICFHFSGTSIGVLRLFNKFNLVAIQKIAISIIRLLVVASLCFLVPDNLILIVSAYVVIDILGHILLTIMSIIIIAKEKHIKVKDIIYVDTKQERREFLGFAFWTHLTSAVDVPVKQLDVIILSTISYEIIAVYKVYKQIGKILVQLSMPISQAIMPQFSDYVARGRIKECYQIVMKIRSAILKVMIPITILITILSPWLLTIVLGELYGKYFYVLTLYLLSRTFALSYATIHPLFVAMGHVKDNFKFTIIANIIYLIIVIILSRIMGILGVVISLFVEYYVIIRLKKNAITRQLKISSN